jgi:hypothetical protein
MGESFGDCLRSKLCNTLFNFLCNSSFKVTMLLALDTKEFL